MKLPKGHLSPSQVDAYHRCGTQYEIFTVGGAKRPPDFFLISHNATHETILEHDMAYKKITGKNRSGPELSEIYRATLEKALPEIKEDRNLETPAVEAIEKEITYFDKIIETTHDFRQKTKPIVVEQRMQFNVGSIPVSVRVDLIEDETINSRVSDLKRKGSGRETPEMSLQLATYSIGTGISDVGFRTIIENKSPKFEVSDGEITDGTVRKVERQYAETAEMISAGIFMPVITDKRTEWVCSAKYCGAWRIDARDWMTGKNISCPYGERARSKPGTNGKK